VDQLAKSVSSTPPLPLQFHFTHRHHHSPRAPPHYTWIDQFSKNIGRHSFYTRVQPSLPTEPWFSYFLQFSRKTIVNISWLRLDHNHLPATLSRFIPTICPYCPLYFETDTLATMNHLFFQCLKLKTTIQKFELLLAYNLPGHGLWHRFWPAKTPKFITL